MFPLLPISRNLDEVGVGEDQLVDEVRREVESRRLRVEWHNVLKRRSFR